MAVAYDANSEYPTGTTGHTGASSFSWTHTPTGTPRGVLVFVNSTGSGSNVTRATSVTYGGTTVPEVTAGQAADAAGELGAVQTFFLGSGISTGAQTVVVNRADTTTAMYAQAITVTGAASTEVYTAGIVLLQGDGTYAQQNVDDGSPGTNSLRFAAGYSGGSNVLAAGANSTALPNSIDYGLYTFITARETTAGQGSRPVGFSYATSDDRAAVHLAVREINPDANVTPAVLAAPAAFPAVTVAVFGSYTAEVTADSPVAWWKLDDASGPVADSADSYSGTVTGSVTLGTDNHPAGMAGPVADWPGTSGSYINTSFRPSGWTALTVEAWINFDGHASGIGKRFCGNDPTYSTNTGFTFALGVSRAASFYLQIGTTTPANAYTESGSTDIPSTGWHHVVGTWDGSNIRVYLDGAKVSTADTALSGTMAQDSGGLELGSWQGGTEPWGGLMCQMAVYDHALTLTRIQAHYNAGITPVSAGDATATPTVLTAPAAFPAPVVRQDQTATPAVLAAPASFPAAAAHGSANASPSVLAAPAAFPAAAAHGSAATAPAVLPAPVSFPAPTVRQDQAVAPAVLAAPASFPAVSVSAGGAAAVTHLTSVISAYPGSNQSVWTTASVSASDGDVVLIFLEQNEASAITPPAVSSVAGLGNSGWTSGITRFAWEGVFRTAQFFWTAISGAQSGTITITLASADTGMVSWSVVKASGYDTSTPFIAANVVTATGTGTSASKAYNQSFGSGDHGLAFVCHHSNETTTVRSSPQWTALGNVNSASPTMALATEWYAGTDTACSASWATSCTYCILGVELKPSGGTQDATATPAVLAAPAAFPAPAVSGRVEVTPAVLAAPAAFPAAAAHGSASMAPAVLAAPAAFPVPVVRQDQAVSPAVLAAPASFPAPSVTASGSATVTAVVLAAPAAFPAPVVRQDQTATPAVLAAPASFPAPSVTAGGSATVTATTLAAPATFPAPTVRQDQRATPAVLAAPATFPTVVVRQDRRITAVVLAAPASFPAAQAGAGAGTSPAVLAVSATFPAPTLATGLTLFPAALTITVAFPAAGIVKQVTFGHAHAGSGTLPHATAGTGTLPHARAGSGELAHMTGGGT